jgi:hypothetical protein
MPNGTSAILFVGSPRVDTLDGLQVDHPLVNIAHLRENEKMMKKYVNLSQLPYHFTSDHISCMCVFRP